MRQVTRVPLWERLGAAKESEDDQNIGLDRIFSINNDKYNARMFCGNHLKRSSYNLANFLPRALIKQFSQLANFYFLIMCLLQVSHIQI